MMVGKSFKIGDLVWVKQPGQDNWPGRIEKPPKDLHSPSKKSHCFVRFFSTNKSVWVKNKAIVLHSEEMLQTSPKRKSASLKKAIEEITNLSQIDSNKISEAQKMEVEVNECAMPLSSKETREELKEEDVLSSNNSISLNVYQSKDKEICDSEVCSQVKEIENCKVDNSSEGHSDLITKEPVDISSSILIDSPLTVEQSDVVMTSVDTVKSVFNSSGSELDPSTLADVVMSPVEAGNLLKDSSTTEVSNIEGPTLTDSTTRGQTDDMVKIGFLGLGRMGSVIVRELMAAGYDVTVWNRTIEKCKFLVVDGAHQGDSPSDVIAKCDITFSCVSDSEASKLLVFGPQGVLHGFEGSEAGTKGYVELSCNDPFTSEEIGKAISDAGGLYLEAPVSLSKDPDKDKIMIIAAGSRELFDKCVLCFRSVSKTTYFIGCEIGSASKLNVIIGSLHGVLYGLLAESLKLAEKNNVSPNTFLSFLDQVADLPTYFIERGKAMLDRQFSATTTLKHQHKLSSLVLSLGADNQSLNLAAEKVSLSLGANKSSSPDVNDISSNPDEHNKSEYTNLLIAYCTQKIFNEALDKYSDKDVSAVYMNI